MQLTSKTVRRLEEINKIISMGNIDFKNKKRWGLLQEKKGIISFKNELKEVIYSHGSGEITSKLIIEEIKKLIKEIEKAEKG